MRQHISRIVLLRFASLAVMLASAVGFPIAIGAQTRSVDGSENNLEDLQMGMAGTPLMRRTTVAYENGRWTPAGANRPSARVVSNFLCEQGEVSIPRNRLQASDFVWQWGQFIDHDIDLTNNATPAEPFDVPVPSGDSYFDPFNTGTQWIFLNRSAFVVDGGGVRQQLNQITTWIDGSNVYGSDQARSDELRTFVGGRLKTSAGNLLPFNVNGFPNAGGPDPTLFLAGDVRANEQAGLTAMHTLFMREHNQYADLFTAGGMGDEDAYQSARIMVWAEIQAITYREFLPIILGRGAISRYQGYNSNVDPSIRNFFSTASYRFGHSMLSPTLLRLDSNLNVSPEGNLPLRDAFFNPETIIDNGIDSLLRGLANQLAQNVDTKIVDDVRNFLFGEPGEGGFDLASLNMQRGRDHGLADYNQARVDYGLVPVTSFAEITRNTELQSKLEATYGSVDNIDGWIGGLAEDHMPGALVGELIRAVLTEQFEALRNGDRYWYENVLPNSTVNFINRQTLSKIIKRNTDIGNELNANAFKVFNR